MNGWHGGGHIGAMWLWWILGIVLIALVIWIMVRPKSRPMDDGAESPEERLKRRYADGEIDKEEYDARLKDLRR